MTSSMRILYLSDSRNGGSLVRCKLAEESIACDLRGVETREEFLDALGKFTFDLFLADWPLPSFDTFSLLTIAREQRPETPFILIAETFGEELVVEAVKAGATDIVLKHRPARLVSVVRRAMRDAERWRMRRWELEELRTEKERLMMTVNVLGEGVLTTDLEGNIVSINRIAEALTGWAQEEAVGKPLARLLSLRNASTRQPCEDPVEKTLATGGSGGLATHAILIAQDGTERHIAYASATVRDRAGQVGGVVLSFHEVVAQPTGQQDLSPAKKLETLRALAGGVADDFNDVITTLVGHIALARLSVETGDEALQRLINESEKAAIMAKQLTWRLQLFARDQEPAAKSTSVADLVLIGKELERERAEKTPSIADIILAGPSALEPDPEMRTSGV